MLTHWIPSYGRYAGQDVRLPPVSRADYQPTLPLATGVAPGAEMDGVILLNGMRPIYHQGVQLTVKFQCSAEWLEFRNYIGLAYSINAAAQNALFDFIEALADGGHGILRGALPDGTFWKDHKVRSARAGAILEATPAVTWNTPDWWTVDAVWRIPTGRVTLLGGPDNSDRFLVNAISVGL